MITMYQNIIILLNLNYFFYQVFRIKSILHLLNLEIYLCIFLKNFINFYYMLLNKKISQLINIIFYHKNSLTNSFFKNINKI